MNSIVPSINPSDTNFFSNQPRIIQHGRSTPYRRIKRLVRKTPFRGLIYQTESIRVRWDIAIITLALYNTFLDPYLMAFGVDAMPNMLAALIDTAIDIAFMVDIYLNFRTSHIDSYTGEEIIDRKLIAKDYCKSGRLLLDVVTCIPLAVIESMVETSSAISLVKLLKLVRILRVSKIIYYMRIDKNIKMHHWSSVYDKLLFGRL